MKPRLLVLVCLLAATAAQSKYALHADTPDVSPTTATRRTTLRFEVAIAPNLVNGSQSGRLLVVLGRSNRPEPRWLIGRTGLETAPVLGIDVEGLQAGITGVVDQS